MRKTLTSRSVALAAICWSLAGGPIFGHGHGSSASSAGATSARGTSSAPSGSSAVNGARFYSGQNFSPRPYYPMSTPRTLGNRTLNYPTVHNSIVRNLNRPSVDRPNGLVSMRSNHLSGVNSIRRPGGTENLTTGHATITRTRLDPQTSTRLRTWNGNVDSAHQARLNHSDHWHHHHDCNWWRHHCLAIVFFDFGWWGWSDGWWYPAWGYDPYSYYQYDEPIYGYDSPEQVVANVQSALQQLGYYQYAVDGKMGPITRAAIGRYQADRRLPITYGVDPATLGSLGLGGRY